MSSKKIISAILLAGGMGSRMKAPLPKQFLLLRNQPIVKYSLDLFLSCEQIEEIVIVCAEEYRYFFKDYTPHIRFALPGERRQDSVYNGLNQTSENCEWVCVHDAARPFTKLEHLKNLIAQGKKTGAATLATPLKNTIKESLKNNIVNKTLDRTTLWEIQTPQFLHKDIITEGFKVAYNNNLTVTDDVALAEILNQPVSLVTGCDTNIKITTPYDLILGKLILDQISSNHV